MISRDTIEEIRNRLDIVDVISDFVSLKKSGQNYKALSPFSNEKTPSFFVVPARGIFKDFSSGKGGDAVTFVMEHEKLTYAEALRYLAKKYGIEIKEERQSAESQAVQSEREGLYILMNYAKDYYRKQLTGSEEGISIGLSYFRERGFNDRTIEKFELGYALEGWENFSKDAVASGYNKELLERTGLIVKKEDGSTYDRFRGRVIFPVHNITGKVIAFGARMLGKEKNQPKYINSPETDIYHKSDVLYGLYQAKNAILRESNCYLVEGYADVISMAQAGIENVVASSGTALTENQLRLINRFSKKITIIFDGDSAGIKAAIRGIDMALMADMDIYAASFPDGDDPDSFSRKVSSTELKNYLTNNSKEFVEFKVDIHAVDVLNDPLKKADHIGSIVNSIALVSNHNKKQQLIRRVSSLLKVDESFLLGELNKTLIKNRRETEKKFKQSRDRFKEQETDTTILDLTKSYVDVSRSIEIQEKETIKLLLNYADLDIDGQKVSDFLLSELEDVNFSNPVYGTIIKMLRHQIEKGELISIEELLKSADQEIVKVVVDLVTPRYDTSKHWADKYHIYFEKDKDIVNELAFSNVLRLKFRIVQKMMEDNLQKVKQAESEGSWEELEAALVTQSDLKEAEQGLAKALGIVIAR